MFPPGTGVWEYTATLKRVAIIKDNFVFMFTSDF
jgi:hypothetical protein